VEGSDLPLWSAAVLTFGPLLPGPFKAAEHRQPWALPS
jgi:hypothetical protein